MKEKIELQLEYARVCYAKETNQSEKDKWDGYIQGLKYALTQIQDEK